MIQFDYVYFSDSWFNHQLFVYILKDCEDDLVMAMTGRQKGLAGPKCSNSEPWNVYIQNGAQGFLYNIEDYQLHTYIYIYMILVVIFYSILFYYIILYYILLIYIIL